MSLKYRCITPNVEVKEYPVAASQKIAHDGGHFVYLDSSGHVTTGVTATTSLIGWAILPKGRGLSSSDAYWQSSASAGADKLRVITDPDAEYLIPFDDTVDQGDVGNACDIVLTTADGSVQKGDVGTSTTDLFVITGVGTKLQEGTTTDGIVKIKTFQADT